MQIENSDTIDLGVLIGIRSQINSYWGIFGKANSYSILKKAMTDLSARFYEYFYFEKYKTTWKCKLKLKYKINRDGALFQSTGIQRQL
ncbi:hypothetical protein D3C87_1580370 [compost metagenome]